MANAVALTDYYAELHVPETTDILGLDNAYARLSGELATIGDGADASSEALRKLNEAYGVLSRADLRRQYDTVFLAAQREAAAKKDRARRRARARLQYAIIGALLAIVLSQAAALAYVGRDHISSGFEAVTGALSPGGAG